MLCTWMWDLSSEFTINKTKKDFYFIQCSLVRKKGVWLFSQSCIWRRLFFSTVLIMRIVTVFLELGSLFVFHWQYRFLSPHSSISCFSPLSSPTVLFPFAIAWLSYSSPLSLLKYCSSHLFHFSFSFFSVLASPLSLFPRLDHVNMLAGEKNGDRHQKITQFLFFYFFCLETDTRVCARACVCMRVHMSCKRWLTLEKANFLTPFQPPHCALLEG